MPAQPRIAATFIRVALPAVTLIGLPLLGIVLTGHEPSPYLEMPPVTRYVKHAGFSLPWFLFFSAADLLLTGALLRAVVCGRRHVKSSAIIPGAANERFPWWGWGGLALGLGAWLMAWKRFAWFWLFQPHTFLPIWAGFILAVNAFTVRRSGRCLLLRRPFRFFLLFPISAGFWWFFEYLNRFVQNWYYTGIEGMGPGEYSYYSSLAFATVLPGVMSVAELLHTIPALGAGLARCRPVHLPATRLIPIATLLVAGTGLALIGLFPDPLFALVWVSPLFIVMAFQALTGDCGLLAPLAAGDWRRLAIPAMAALICGFFWEMWNYFSLARWTYTIPYVQRFHLFEMPILGYGGYLPFGLVCFLAAVPVIGDPFVRDDGPAS